MHDSEQNIVKIVFTMGTCDNIVDAQVGIYLGFFNNFRIIREFSLFFGLIF